MTFWTTAAAALGIIERSEPTQDTTMLPGIQPPTRATTADALTLDSVYRAVQLYQTAVSQLTLDAWRNGQKLEDTPTWLDTPDELAPHTPAWFAEVVSSLALRGNAYALISRNNSGQVTRLQLVSPLEVSIDQRGLTPTYHYRGRSYTRHDMAHLALMRRTGHLYGLGPIQACQTTVDGAAKLRTWADQWIDTAAVPSAILSSSEVVTAADAKTAKERFVEAVRYNNGPVVLGNGFTYTPMLLKPEEVQWLEAQNFNVVAIARLFGVPPRLMLAVLDGGSETYSNQQQEELSFVRWSVMTYLREIEALFSRLLPRGTQARFNLDAILRADTLTRYQAHKLGIDAGFLTVPDVRKIEHLP